MKCIFRNSSYMLTDCRYLSLKIVHHNISLVVRWFYLLLASSTIVTEYKLQQLTCVILALGPLLNSQLSKRTILNIYRQKAKIWCDDHKLHGIPKGIFQSFMSFKIHRVRYFGKTVKITCSLRHFHEA